jgi:hypothetical protein
MNELILFHEPKKNYSEMIIDHFISQTKHLSIYYSALD